MANASPVYSAVGYLGALQRREGMKEGGEAVPTPIKLDNRVLSMLVPEERELLSRLSIENLRRVGGELLELKAQLEEKDKRIAELEEALKSFALEADSHGHFPYTSTQGGRFCMTRDCGDYPCKYAKAREALQEGKAAKGE